jgi:hypothetical protein
MNPNKQSIEEMFHSTAQSIEPEPRFSDELWRQIKLMPARPATRIDRLRAYFSRPAWAAAALPLLALIFALANPRAVMAAFDRLIGFFPEIGFVEAGETTLYLPEPVTVEKGGLRLILDQAVSDPNGLVIAYHIDGLPATPQGETIQCVYDGVQLRLPDGKTHHPIGGSSHGSEARIEFKPLPTGVDEAVLHLSQNFPDPACTAPQDLEADFKLVPMPAQMTLAPVYQGEDIQAPSPLPTEETPEPVAEGEAAVPTPQLSFAIDRVAELDDGYVVSAHAEWEDQRIKDIYPDFEALEVLDAGGQSVPVEPSEEGSSDSHFAFKVMGKSFKPPFTLHVKRALAFAIEEGGPTFSFDAGANPQTGQSWEIGKAIQVFGYELKIDKVSVISSAQSTPDTYVFEMQAPEELQNPNLRIVQNSSSMGYGGSGRPLPGGGYRLELTFSGGLPTGKLEFGAGQITLALDGDWQASWQVPGQ